MKCLLSLLFVVASTVGSFAQNQLPKEMLLQCEGVRKIIFLKPPLDMQSKPFKDNYRLHNGNLDLSGSKADSVKNCELDGDEVHCESHSVETFSTKSTQKKHSVAILSRHTGEFRMTIDALGFKGQPVGNPDSSMKIVRTGVCRTIGSPLF